MSPPVDLARWALARELLADVRPRVADADPALWHRFQAAAREYALAEPVAHPEVPRSLRRVRRLKAVTPATPPR